MPGTPRNALSKLETIDIPLIKGKDPADADVAYLAKSIMHAVEVEVAGNISGINLTAVASRSIAASSFDLTNGFAAAMVAVNGATAAEVDLTVPPIKPTPPPENH